MSFWDTLGKVGKTVGKVGVDIAKAGYETTKKKVEEVNTLKLQYQEYSDEKLTDILVSCYRKRKGNSSSAMAARMILKERHGEEQAKKIIKAQLQQGK